jgi:hypothetical protein
MVSFISLRNPPIRAKIERDATLDILLRNHTSAAAVEVSDLQSC